MSKCIILGSILFLVGLCSEARAWGMIVQSITPPETYSDGTAMNPDVVAWYNVCLNPEGQVPTSTLDCALHTILYQPPARLEDATSEVAGRYCLYAETVVDASANHPVVLGATNSGYALMTNNGVPACHDYKITVIPMAPANVEASSI